MGTEMSTTIGVHLSSPAQLKWIASFNLLHWRPPRVMKCHAGSVSVPLLSPTTTTASAFLSFRSLRLGTAAAIPSPLLRDVGRSFSVGWGLHTKGGPYHHELVLLFLLIFYFFCTDDLATTSHRFYANTPRRRRLSSLVCKCETEEFPQQEGAVVRR